MPGNSEPTRRRGRRPGVKVRDDGTTTDRLPLHICVEYNTALWLRMRKRGGLDAR